MSTRHPLHTVHESVTSDMRQKVIYSYLILYLFCHKVHTPMFSFICAFGLLLPQNVFAVASEQSLTDRKTIPFRTANGNGTQIICFKTHFKENVFTFDIFYKCFHNKIGTAKFLF